MSSATTKTSDMGCGVTLWTVTVGDLVAHGTATGAERPGTWTVLNARKGWAFNGVTLAELRRPASRDHRYIHRGRTLAGLVKAIETGRI